MFLAFKFSRETAIKLNFKNASVSHSFRYSSLTIIWNNLDLSNYNRMKRKLGLKKNNNKNTPVVISKRNYLVPYSKESPLSLMHLCISQPFHRSG